MKGKMFDNIQAVVNEIVSRSEQPDDDVYPKRFEGALTHLVNDVLGGTQKYSYVVGIAKEMGVLEQLRRGGNQTASVWLVHKPVDINEFEPAYRTFYQMRQKAGKTVPASALKDLSDRLLVVEQHLGLREQI